ncbi:hypothetical protein [Microbacterium algeriense]|uniref:DUF2746 domain-containing protein n=1 Tax=Microbacterium algeriense TaxID=2615184 RepID=A0ABQ6VAF5_9MICO|nr:MULTISPECIES: hypothetical protein [Microbacterium]KAB1866701.1 hypothetical protein F6A08_02470 [Microbacterium algeriense]
MRLNDPQVWTLIGVFAAVMLGGMTLMTTQLSRIIRTEVDRIDGTLSARMDLIDGTLSARMDRIDGSLSARMDGLDGTLSARIDGVDARLGRIEAKVEDLDKELTNLATRFWRSQ